MSFAKKVSTTKDGKVMGRQMSNVAPTKQEELTPPSQEELTPPSQEEFTTPSQEEFTTPSQEELTPAQRQLLPKLVRQQSLVQLQLSLCSLPDTALEKLLLFLTYDTIAKLRGVNKRFDVICKGLLNKGFRIAQRIVSNSFQQAKSKLPRRQSERDSHPMWSDYEILNSINLELSLFNVTFEKFINDQSCCFIPGKVLDEIFIIMSALQEQDDARRPYSILNELRDLSRMALEYFDEKIAPSFQKELEPVYSSWKFPAEEEEASSDEYGDGPVTDIRENKEAIRACKRKVSKLTKQKKQMKMQLTNMTMQIKQLNVYFNATMKQQKAYFKATMKQQKENFEATMKEMNLKIELDRKAKTQEEVTTDQQAVLGDKDPTPNALKEEVSEPDVSNGNEGVYSIDKQVVKVQDELADEIIDGIVCEVSENEEIASKQQQRQSEQDEPPTKRQRTEDTLIPDAEFIARNLSPVAIKVIVPKMEDKTEWKCSGQTLTLNFHLHDTVADIKARIREEAGVPTGMQKLQQENIYYEDTNTLAYYNITPGTVVNLKLKERGGRKK